MLGTTLGAPPVPGVEADVRLNVSVVDVTKAEPSPVFDQQKITITALGIPHGNVPTLAYRIQTRDASIVFSSDQTGMRHGALRLMLDNGLANGPGRKIVDLRDY